MMYGLPNCYARQYLAGKGRPIWRARGGKDLNCSSQNISSTEVPVHDCYLQADMAAFAGKGCILQPPSRSHHQLRQNDVLRVHMQHLRNGSTCFLLTNVSEVGPHLFDNAFPCA